MTESRWGLVAPSLDRAVTDRVLHVIATEKERVTWVGYRLPSMFEQAGLTDVREVSHDSTVCEHDDLFRFTNLRWSVDTAVRAGAVTRAQADTWRDCLGGLVTRGESFAVVIILHVAGTKP